MIHIHVEVDVDRGIDDVFDFFSDPESRLQWQPELVSHQHEPMRLGADVTEVRNVLGRRLELRGRVTEFAQNRTIAYHSEGPVVKSIAYHYRFEPVGHRTRIYVEVNFEPNEALGQSRQLIQSIVKRNVENAMEHLQEVLENEEAARHLRSHLPRHAHP